MTADLLEYFPFSLLMNSNTPLGIQCQVLFKIMSLFEGREREREQIFSIASSRLRVSQAETGSQELDPSLLLTHHLLPPASRNRAGTLTQVPGYGDVGLPSSIFTATPKACINRNVFQQNLPPFHAHVGAFCM